MAETETYKKVEEVVIENVVGKDTKQRYHFRALMPEELAGLDATMGYHARQHPPTAESGGSMGQCSPPDVGKVQPKFSPNGSSLKRK